MKTLKPSLAYLKTGLPLLKHKPQQVVERVRGDSAKALKKRCLARAGWLCECEECRAPGALPLKLTWATCEMDHRVPLFEGGDNSIGNLRALHIDCHKRITAAQAQERALLQRVWSDEL